MDEALALQAAVSRTRPLHQHSTREPQVWRGLVRHWPAVTRWTFEHLGALDRQRPVQIVQGNRETLASRLVDTTWGQHMDALQHARTAVNSAVGHLKEFDLLQNFPALAHDVDLAPLFPPKAVVSSQAWIGPAEARTGLHHDLLDNLAFTIRGRKRFYLAPPGTVESMRLVSRKFDRWAKLSQLGIDELMAASCAVTAGLVQVIDLAPGDALFVPRGWWHEVVNLEASILLSGFFGSRARTWAVWAQTGATQLLHNAGLWRRGQCTCHTEQLRAAER
jgi:hypothetical protein